jgi:Peroxidase
MSSDSCSGILDQQRLRQPARLVAVGRVHLLPCLLVALLALATKATACPFMVGDSGSNDNGNGRMLRHHHGVAGAEHEELTAAADEPTATATSVHDRLLQSSQPTTLDQSISMATQQISDIIVFDLDTNWAAKFVRLVFHDCVGGICDGCVDITNPSNFGLEPPIDKLAPIVAFHSAFLTPGDVWVLAGLTASRVMQKSTTSQPFPFTFVGRPHCGNSKAGPPRTLPSAHFTTSQVLNFFASQFNYTSRDTVAILGSHSLYVVLMRCNYSLCTGYRFPISPNTCLSPTEVMLPKPILVLMVRGLGIRLPGF